MRCASGPVAGIIKEHWVGSEWWGGDRPGPLLELRVDQEEQDSSPQIHLLSPLSQSSLSNTRTRNNTQHTLTH